MRYGSPPLVRATGGLATSVVDELGDPELANGFGFTEYSPEALAEAVERAMVVFESNPSRWAQLQRNGMERDSSWDPSAARYLDLYLEVLGRQG